MPPIEELSLREPGEPPEFGWEGAAQRDFALAATAALTDLPEAWTRRGESFEPGAPKPAPALRVGPRI